MTLDSEFIDTAHIEITDLDMDYGKPCDGGDQFIKVLPLREVQEVLEEWKPWLHYRDYSDEHETQSQWWCAFTNFDNIARWLRLPGDEDEESEERYRHLIPLCERVHWWKAS